MESSKRCFGQNLLTPHFLQNQLAPPVWLPFFHKYVLWNTLYICVLVKKNIEPMKSSKNRFGQNLLTPTPIFHQTNVLPRILYFFCVCFYLIFEGSMYTPCVHYVNGRSRSRETDVLSFTRKRKKYNRDDPCVSCGP